MRALILPFAVGALATVLAAAPARAENAMAVCGVRYRAAVAAKSLPAGQTWPKFLAECRRTLTGATTSAARVPTPAQQAARDRQQRCSAEWKTAKAAGRLTAGETWPHYWSACNTRLKGA